MVLCGVSANSTSVEAWLSIDYCMSFGSIRRFGWRWLKSKLYYEPMLRSQVEHIGVEFELLDDIPNILGELSVNIGDRVRMEGDHTWNGSQRHRRAASS